ncbi:MAG: hypothetical protein H6585_11335 [Flavobacteriales bacterium]|nr:hypothetical protein [Flavobacteriales bacterium]MCB9448927.1 hypothetical protein [Flavobacteriales bacterium]
MENIKLDARETTAMKEFYQEEYDKAVRRLQHIENILSQLGVTGGKWELESNPTKRRQSAGGDTSTKKKKPGPKSVWRMLVLKRLRQVDRPLTYDQLTEEIMGFANIPAQRQLSTKQAILQVCFKLRTIEKRIDTASLGVKEKYLGLKSWFSSPGVLKSDYAKRAELIKKEGTSGKTKTAAKAKAKGKSTPRLKAGTAKSGKAATTKKASKAKSTPGRKATKASATKAKTNARPGTWTKPESKRKSATNVSKSIAKTLANQLEEVLS